MFEQRTWLEFSCLHLLERNLFWRARRLHCWGAIRTGTQWCRTHNSVGHNQGPDTVMLKKNREVLPTSSYPSYVLPSLPCSTLLPVIPQQLNASLKVLEHCLSQWEGKKDEKGALTSPRITERSKEFTQLCYNTRNRRKFKRLIIEVPHHHPQSQ